MKKKILLIAVIMAAVFTGCSEKTEDKETNGENNTTETVAVTDLLGREVEVPDDVESVIALGAGGLRMLCYADAQDMVIGVEKGEHEKTLAKCYNYVYNDIFKELPVVGTGGSGSYEAYEEEILKLAPDVIFASYPEDLADDLQSKTGIPVVVVTYDGGMFDEKLYKSMELIGQILDKEERCSEVVNSLKEWQTDLSSRTSDILEESKPRVFTGACSFKGGHGIEGTYTNFPPFTAIGALNVADELSDKVGGVIVDLEQIAVWDPEYIFLDPNNMQLVNDDYAVNSDFYDSLSAVKNGNVYTQVAYNWYTTNVETAVVDAYYAGKIIFPNAFDDIDIENLAVDVYTTLLGEDAEGYYDELVKGGLGWQQIKIGE
ncbi:MAG: iron ABC transporter substrate-binding protein [Clostridiales bacterium]|nr:iron ABC transporter substrate-binding protein [Clostridiales bacterium]